MKSSRGLELCVLLACALGAASAVQADCFADPSAAACSSFTVNDTAVQAELDQICTSNGTSKASNGWPAACTLLSECRAGRAQAAFCHPLGLALTACQEQPVLPFCSRYSTLCGAQSVVRQCKSEAALGSVPTADAAFTAATQMCAEMSMSGCQQCSTTTAAGTVQAQAVQVQCPDPLGSLSTMCMEMWMPQCSVWDAFCKAAANNTAFPALCDYTYVPPPSPPAPEAAPAPSPEASTPAVPAAGNNSTAAAQANSSTICLQDPTRSECASFVLDGSMAEADIAALCASMPNMVGCTFWTQCQTSRASGPLCSPFSLYATVCSEMGSMRDCADYNTLCATPGSVVRQCSAEGAVPAAPSTDDATAALLSMCGDHPMDGCDDCTSRSACPHPMETLSRVCLEMPGMSGCAPFNAMCDKAGSTFSELCGGGGGGGSLPAMKMWLHAGTRDIILIKSWVPESAGAYAASCIAVIALALVVQALKALRVLSEARWAAERRSSCCGDRRDDKRDSSLPGAALIAIDAGSPASSGSARGGRFVQDVPLRRRLPSRDQVGRNAVRSAFTVVVVFLDYMLMLIVMTFNIGLIISAVAGFGAGALLFGHLGEGGSGAVAVGAGNVAPDSENDLEVHFVDPQPCCNTHRV